MLPLPCWSSVLVPVWRLENVTVASPSLVELLAAVAVRSWVATSY